MPNCRPITLLGSPVATASSISRSRFVKADNFAIEVLTGSFCNDTVMGTPLSLVTCGRTAQRSDVSGHGRVSMAGENQGAVPSFDDWSQGMRLEKEGRRIFTGGGPRL